MMIIAGRRVLRGKNFRFFVVTGRLVSTTLADKGF
jgi:hypothetical protein